MYYLDLVLDATNYPLDEIKKNTLDIRPVGLGVMGLADLAIKLNIKYGSDSFRILCMNIATCLSAYALKADIDLAKLKGCFNAYTSLDHNGVKDLIYSCLDFDCDTVEDKQLYLEQLYDSEKSKDSINTELFYYFVNKKDMLPRSLANSMTSLYQMEGNYDWIYDLLFYGLRNSRRLSIAPTGTISLICGCSSGIEPNFAFKWTRDVMLNEKEKETLTFYHPLYNEDNIKKGLLITANKLDIESHLFPVKIFAQIVDSAISKTVNLPEEATVEDVKEIYKYCFDNNIKGITIYRNNSRDSQPINEIKKDKNKINNTEYSSIKNRPKIMHGVTTKSDSPWGSIYVTANFDTDGNIFESFISAGKSGSENKAVTEALSRVISLALRAGVDLNDIVKTISNISGSEIWIYDTIDGKEVYVRSIPDSVAKMLKDLTIYYKSLNIDVSNIIEKENTKENTEVVPENKIDIVFGKYHKYCPECGTLMNNDSSCGICKSCGYSNCK